jgi:DNA replication protein DnaC
VPDTVLDDLAEGYATFVRVAGCDYQPSPEVSAAIRSCASWLKNGRPGLVISGTVGTGKTIMVKAIAALIEHYDRLYRTGNLHANVTVHSAADICEKAASKDSDVVAGLAVDLKKRYVIIDDLGVEPMKVKNWGTDVNPIVDALYRRYSERKVTIISTNLNKEAMLNRYGERLSDRLKEQYSLVTMAFKSFRS